MAIDTGAGGGNFYVDINLPEAAGGQQMPIIPEREKNPAGEQDEALLKEQTRTSDILEAIYNSLKLDSRAQKDFNDRQEDYASKEMNMMKSEATTPQNKKRADKIQEYFQKKMVVADFFTKTGAVLKSIAKSLAGFGMEIIKALMILALLGPEFLDGIIDLVVSTIMMVVQALIAAIPTVVNALVKWIPIIIQMVVGALKQIIPILADALPKLIGVLAGALVEIIKGIAQILPVLIPALIKVFVTVILELVKLLPILIETFVRLVSVIIGELVNLLQDPAFIGAMILAFTAVITALVKAVPVIIKALVDLVPAIFDAMIKVFDSLAGNEALPGWLRAIFSFLSTMQKIYKEVFLGLVSVISWIIDNFSTIVDIVKEAFTAFWNAITFLPKQFIRFGKFLMAVIWKFWFKPIIDAFKKVGAAVLEIIQKMMAVISPSNIISKIGESIKSAAKTIIDSIFGPGKFAELSAIFGDLQDFFKKLWKTITDSGAYKAIFGGDDKADPEDIKRSASLLAGLGGNLKQEDIVRNLGDKSSMDKVLNEFWEQRHRGTLTPEQAAYYDMLEIMKKQLDNGKSQEEVMKEMNDKLARAAAGADAGSNLSLAELRSVVPDPTIRR